MAKKSTQVNKYAQPTKSVFSFEVIMLVHVIADTPEEARTQLDDKGGMMTKREVKLLNATPLYGEMDLD